MVEKNLAKDDPDRVLWTLTERGGSMTKSDLARRLHMKIAELDAVLRGLERARKIKLVERKGKLMVELRTG
jgi:transcription initiation factor IIE alpha subunit